MERLLRHALGRVSSTGAGHLGSHIEAENIRPGLWFRAVFSLRMVLQQRHHSLAGLPFGARMEHRLDDLPGKDLRLR